MSLTTAQAIDLVATYGRKLGTPGFIETMEVLQYQIDAPDHIREFLVSPKLVQAYHVVFADLETMFGAVI